MFILIAVLAMCVPIMGFCVDMVYFNTYKKPVLAALLCGLAFSAAVYGYIPDEGNDIIRHMESLRLYADVPLYDAFNMQEDYNLSAVYTWDVWLWLISKLGNPQLLQSSGALVGYSLLSYLFFDIARQNRYKFRQWLPLLLIVLAFSNPLGICIGVRSSNAFLLCLLAFYRYFYKQAGKWSTLLILIIAIFLHHAALVVLLAWLGLPFLVKHKWLAVVGAGAVLAFFATHIEYLFSMFGGDSNSGLLGNTLYSSFNYSEGAFNNSLYGIVYLLWNFWCAGLLIYFVRFHCFNRMRYVSSIKDRQVFNLTIFLFIVSIFLTIILGNNGLRFLQIIDYLLLIMMFEENFDFSLGRNGRLSIPSMLLLGTSVGTVIFDAYRLNWGTGSLFSLLKGMILGYSTNLW